MSITFFSFFMAVFWSSIAILLFCSCRKRQWFIRHCGISIMAVLYFACVLRLLVPVEVNGMAYVKLRGAFSSIYELVGLKKTEVFGLECTVLQIFIAVWIAGSLIKGIYWGICYYKADREIQKLLKYSGKRDEKLLNQVQGIFRKNIPVQVWKSSDVEIPAGFGILRKIILIPEGSYTENQYLYMLRHEYTHFLNHDIEIKLLMQLFCCVFWWNPCAWLLQKEIAQVLEIRCDLAVTQNMGKEEKKAYLDTVIAIIQNTVKKEKVNPKLPSAALFRRKDEKAIVERFQAVRDERCIREKSWLFRCGMLILIGVFLCSSYLFQFQAAFPSPEIQGELTAENTYLVDNEDGTYTIVSADGADTWTVSEENVVIKAMIAQDFEVKR